MASRYARVFHSFPKGYSLAFAYGSGVFKQIGHKNVKAFRSPFRSPRPADDNSVDAKKTPTSGQASASKNVDVNEVTYHKVTDGDIVRDLRVETPKKSVLNKGASSHTTPQRAGSSLHNFQKKVYSQQFRSPFRSPSSRLIKPPLETSEDQLANLMKQEAELDKEIAAIQESGFQVEELQGHIENLHTYNEVKDAAQIVLGRLAELDQVPLKEMHKKYNVPITE